MQPMESNRSRIEPHALKPSSVHRPAPCNVLTGTVGWPAVAPGEGTQRYCHLLLLKPVPDADTSDNCFGFYKKEAVAGLKPPVSMNFWKVLSKSEIGSFLTHVLQLH